MYVCTYETLILNASTQDSSYRLIQANVLGSNHRSTLKVHAIHHLGYKTQILSEKGNFFHDSFQYAFLVKLRKNFGLR